MFSTLHKEENKSANGWRISRWKFFYYFFIGSCSFYFLPGLLMPALSYFSVITWFAPKNVVLANLPSRKDQHKVLAVYRLPRQSLSPAQIPAYTKASGHHVDAKFLLAVGCESLNFHEVLLVLHNSLSDKKSVWYILRFGIVSSDL
ncbi:hypothetical protein LTR39_004658 [Cryomyces antarcticus]|nr:hypothetical protein LTR39_004658 [Cryomyces antarcticus]